MAYFFGFFGISFLDTNAMARSPSSFGLSHLDQHLYTSRNDTRGDVFDSTMCAKEAPRLATSSVAGATKGHSLPSLGPIPEGEEFSSMTDDEVQAR